MRRHYLELLDYDRWATLRIVDASETHSLPEVRKWLSILVLEREVWVMRLLSGPFDQNVHSVLSWSEIRHKLELTQKELAQFLGGLNNRDFQQLMDWSPHYAHLGTSIKDMLSHVMQEGNSIRGRLITLLEREQIPVPDIRFLTYCQRKPAPDIQWRLGQS